MEKKCISLVESFSEAVRDLTEANKAFNGQLHEQVNQIAGLVIEIFGQVNTNYNQHVANLQICRDNLMAQNQTLIKQNERLMHKVTKLEEKLDKQTLKYENMLSEKSDELKELYVEQAKTLANLAAGNRLPVNSINVKGAQ